MQCAVRLSAPMPTMGSSRSLASFAHGSARHAICSGIDGGGRRSARLATPRVSTRRRCRRRYTRAGVNAPPGTLQMEGVSARADYPLDYPGKVPGKKLPLPRGRLTHLERHEVRALPAPVLSPREHAGHGRHGPAPRRVVTHVRIDVHAG